MNNNPNLTKQSVLNAAPQLVAWGLAHGLMSYKPRWKSEDPGYRLKIAATQRECMRKLLERRAEAERVLELPL